jgi:hypothetical protein
MRSKLRNEGVFSLSAVDLFASAMGAFLIITIILMPDYQKEVRLEGHLAYLESLAAQTEALLNETEQGKDSIRSALLAAQTRHIELQAEQQITSAELDMINAQLQARLDHPPPPPPEPADTEEDTGSNLVTFRFLGLKTDQTRILVMVDMNKYLAEHEELVRRTVARALDSLQEGYEFAVLGFQQTDVGPLYHRWPETGGMAVMSSRNRSLANRFLRGLSGRFEGGSPLSEAFKVAFSTDAEAIILISDGLPNPAFNNGLPPVALVQDITLANMQSREIHAVTIGDYFKYKGTVEFMETLAKANNGGFLALAQ